MNTPQDPRQAPLQDDEADLARVLRALPAGEPSARVDAAILAAATDAVGPRENATPPRRRLPAWALGTAAAAVLAIGIGLQLRPPLAPEPPLPAEAPVLRQEAAKPAATTAELAAEASADASGDAAAGPLPAAAPPAPPPPPAPAIAPPAEAPALDQIVVSGSRLKPAEDRAEDAERTADAPESHRQREAGAAAQRTEVMLEPAPVAAPPAMAEPAALPPVDEDAALEPAAWIERIRERLQQGDTAGARASLLRLLQAHPDTDIPADLAPLRS